MPWSVNYLIYCEMAMNAPAIKTRPPVRRHRSKLNRQRTAKHKRTMMFAGVNLFFIVCGGLTGILLGAIVIHKISPVNPVSQEVRAIVARMIAQ